LSTAERPTQLVPGFAVDNGRCPHCGRSTPTWTASRILEALRAEASKRGRSPFMSDWIKATVEHPAAETVRDVFGTWKNALEQAGLDAAVCSRTTTVREWTKDEAIVAIFEWRYARGDLPKAHDWSLQTHDHPSQQQVRRLFGTWNAAIEAAGYTPRRSSKGRGH
jgi:hypothetical protein